MGLANQQRVQTIGDNLGEMRMTNTLKNRLRGEYQVGPNGEFGKRDFSHFIPPICFEAADRISALEEALKPFAKFACSDKEDCSCHNCRARDLLEKI